MPDQERDPRVDPKSGDVLERALGQREVRTHKRGVSFWWTNNGGLSLGRESLSEWRKWAATAKVIHRAEDAATGREKGRA